MNDAVWALIQICWAHNPSDRPTSRDLLKKLHRAIDGDNTSHQVLRLILADKDTSVHLSVMDVEELKELCNFVDEVNEIPLIVFQVPSLIFRVYSSFSRTPQAVRPQYAPLPKSIIPHHLEKVLAPIFATS